MIMMKMLIQLDEERIKADGKYSSKKMWDFIDEVFEDKKCIKEVQPDGSVMYSGNPNSNSLLADFCYAHWTFVKWNLFAKYCSKWIWYDNEFDEDSPFDEDDVLAKERIRTPLFAKYAR